jgi:hypothetical protein
MLNKAKKMKKAKMVKKIKNRKNALQMLGEWPTNDEEMCAYLTDPVRNDDPNWTNDMCRALMSFPCFSGIVWGCSDANSPSGNVEGAGRCLETAHNNGQFEDCMRNDGNRPPETNG